MLAIRAPFSAGAGALLSLALFLGLAKLVNVPFEAKDRIVVPDVVLKRPRVDTPVDTKRDPQPKREVPILEPGLPNPIVDTIGGSVTRVPYTRPKIELGPRDGGPMSGVDTDVIPQIRVLPEYPPQAIAGNIEGWVRVRFTVTTIGTVRGAVVVDSEPGTVFDEAALNAIARWRYRPRVEHGEAVERVGLQYVFRFELENSAVSNR
jgi:protein TonB